MFSKKSLLINIFQFFIVVFLFSVVGLNQYQTLYSPDNLSTIRNGLFSLSRGNRYYSLLQVWYFFAQKNDWSTAAALETYLDPADTALYKSTHHPDEIKKTLSLLLAKPSPSVEDNIEIARLYLTLNDRPQAAKYIRLAYDTDPIHQDLDIFNLQLSQ